MSPDHPPDLSGMFLGYGQIKYVLLRMSLSEIMKKRTMKIFECIGYSNRVSGYELTKKITKRNVKLSFYFIPSAFICFIVSKIGMYIKIQF